MTAALKPGPSRHALETVIDGWTTAAETNRALARRHQSSRDKAMQGVFIARANQLDVCTQQLKDILDGPKQTPCRCGRDIVQTPVGTWKHVDRLPMAMCNHIAKPA